MSDAWKGATGFCQYCGVPCRGVTCHAHSDLPRIESDRVENPGDSVDDADALRGSPERGMIGRMRNTWGLFNLHDQPERTAAWRTIWRVDRERALRTCDAIVSERDIPERLMRRLGVTMASESHPRNSAAR